MDLDPYVATLRQEFATAAEAAGDEVRAVAERLTAPLEASVRLALLEALSAAADEITTDLAPGSVHVRLRGRDPSFVVSPPPAAYEQPDDLVPAAAAPGPPGLPAPPTAEGDEGVTARINFRLPEGLKGRIEEAAEQAGLSVNNWLVRAAAAALDTARPDPGRVVRVARGSQHFSGWVR